MTRLSRIPLKPAVDPKAASASAPTWKPEKIDIRPRPLTSATMAVAEQNGVTGRVLVVDDFRQARESIADALRSAGHQVECVASGSEALVQLEKECFDVIVTDLQMPGMSGLELIRHLERRPHGRKFSWLPPTPPWPPPWKPCAAGRSITSKSHSTSISWNDW